LFLELVTAVVSRIRDLHLYSFSQAEAIGRQIIVEMHLDLAKKVRSSA
jgi:hypothetical protein